LVAPGEGGRRGRGQPLRTPIAFPVSSAPPGRGPSREVASPGGPEPTRATESWEGNPDTPPYVPAPEEGERIQRDLGRAATFSFSRARGWRQPDGLSPCIAFPRAGGLTAGPGRRRRRWVVGDSGGRRRWSRVWCRRAREGREKGPTAAACCGHPLMFPFSAPPGCGPSREVASPVVPQPTRATESWEGNPDTPFYSPAPEEGERIQREPGTAAPFSSPWANGWRQPDGLSPCIAFPGGVTAGPRRRRRPMGPGGFRGRGRGGRGFGGTGRGREKGSRAAVADTHCFPSLLCPSRPRTLPGGCKPGSSPTDTGYGNLGRKPGHPSLRSCTGGG